jgi:hypothetical protein
MTYPDGEVVTYTYLPQGVLDKAIPFDDLYNCQVARNHSFTKILIKPGWFIHQSYGIILRNWIYKIKMRFFYGFSFFNK